MKNEDFGNLNLDEEFFPLNEDFDSLDGKDKNKPVTFKSYTKNLINTTKTIIGGVAKTLLPETSEIISEIGIAKDTAVDAARIGIDKVKEKLQRKSTGKGIKDTITGYAKEIVKDVKTAVKTGDFTFGANDMNLSFGDEFSFEDSDLESDISTSKESNNTKIYKSPESDMSTISNQMKDSAEKSSSIAISLEKAAETQNMKLFVASENSENARHIQSVGYVANIDTNVEKIAKYFSTIGVQSVTAQMEYSQKALALQEDTIKLLNIIKEQTYTPRNDKDENYSGGLLSSIFGHGFNGGEWANTIIKNFSESFEYSPIGAMVSSLGSAGSMGMSPGKMIGSSLFSMLPGLLLNTNSRIKLDQFDSLMKTMPGIANSKLNQMAMTSNNPVLRMLGSFLGVKELSAKKIDLGVKDLGAKANFDQKFYHSVTEAIPGLLSKILAVQSGQGEVYYDFKAGTFKSGEQAVRQYEHEKSKVYQSSIKYNEVVDRISDQSESTIKETEPELNEKEVEEKSKIMRKDFSIISQNIASVNALFDPETSLTNKSYQDLISQGVTDPNNLLYFIKIFKKLHKNDKMVFAEGAQETRQNLGDFFHRTVPEMVKSGAGGSFVADALINEQIAEAEKLLKFQDIGKHFDVDNPIQRIAKMKYLKGQEEIKMKYGGRVGTIKAVDTSDIGNIAEKGVSNTQLGVLNNIYELLLGGIIVYPNKNIPKHLLTNIEAYNTNKETSIKNKQLLEEEKELEDEELRRSRKEQAILAYKTKQSLKGLPGQIFQEKFGTSETKEKINNQLQEFIDKMSNKVFTGVYGKNEETNEGKLSYEEELARSVESGSLKIADSLSKLLKQSKPSDNAEITKKAVETVDLDKEYTIDKNSSIMQQISTFAKRETEKILQDLYGGNVNVEKINEMIKKSELGERRIEEKKEITKIATPTDNEADMGFDESKPKNSFIVNLDDTNNHLLSIDKTTKDIFTYISNKKEEKIYNPKTKSEFTINTSKNIVASIDSLHSTNKEFFEKVLKSGMFDTFKRIDSNTSGFKEQFSNFNINLKGMTGNLEIMLGKLLSGISIPGINPEMINSLKENKKESIFTKAKRLSTKAVKGSINVAKSTTSKGLGFLSGLIPGLGKAGGKVASGAGGLFGGGLGLLGSILGLGFSGVKTAAKMVPGALKLGGKVASGVLSLFKGGAKGGKGVLSGAGKGIGGILSGFGKAASGAGGALGKVLSGLGTGGKKAIEKIFNFKNTDMIDENYVRREPMSEVDAINEILHEVTLIRTGLQKKSIAGGTIGVIKELFGNIVKLPFTAVKSVSNSLKKVNDSTKKEEKLTTESIKEEKPIIEEKKEIIKEKSKSFKEKVKDSKDSLVNSIKNAFSSINIFKKKDDTKTSNANREGSYLDQQKDMRDKLMLDAEISMNKNIVEIRDMLYSFFNEDKKSRKKKKSSSESEKKEGLFEKIGGFGTVGLTAGATLLGAGLYQSTRGKSKLNKETGLDQYGSTGDKFLSGAGLESGSKYGFDGRELSFGERSAQSSSISHAPQALMTANALYKGGKALNKKVFKLGTSGAQKVAETAAKVAPKSKSIGLLVKITKDIPGSILGLFDKIFANKFVNKLVSSKMVSGIKSGLTKILKPQLFKGIASKIGQKLMALAGPIGIAMSVNDFITGLDSAPRYFSLGKGAKPNLAMRVISGVVNVLSSFLFGLIPADLIVTTLYNIIGSEEEKDYISGFKKFTEDKAKILEVPAGPLGEFETKNFWQRMFGSGKKDAGTLNFGTDEKGFSNFKTWRDEKYKPVEELREKISKEFGGDSITGKIPSSPDEKENQTSYREKFLSSASDLVKTINEVMKSKQDKDESKDNKEIKEEKPKTMLDSSKDTKLPSVDTKTTATTGAIVAGSSLLNKKVESPDVSIPESVENIPNSIKSGIKESDSINNAMGMPSTESISTSSEAVTTVTAAAAGVGGISVKPPTKKQEPEKINKDDYKLTNTDEKQGIGSPVVDDMQNVTKNINTELDALLSIHTEQLRHNSISEEFYENAIKLFSILVETGKSSFDLDKSRNEILAKSFLIDVDPKYKRFMRQNTDTVDLRTDSNGKVGGEGFFGSMFGGKKSNKTSQIQSSPSQIALGQGGSKPINSANEGYDKGEKSFSNKEIDMTSFDSNSYSFDDQKETTGETDNLSSVIENYKKDNPTNMKIIQNVGNTNEVSNYIQNSIFGRNSTHELYQNNIPVIYNGKKIGLKSVYIPKVNNSGIRSGDVIAEIKFLNGDKQYLIDNTGENTMSLNIDYSKGKFDKGIKTPVININTNSSKQENVATSTSKMVEFISNGGR